MGSATTWASPPPIFATCSPSGGLEAPNRVLLAESGGYWPLLYELVQDGRISGAQVHDARIAAPLCLHHGVSELSSADRDFSRFPELKVRNPLIP